MLWIAAMSLCRASGWAEFARYAACSNLEAPCKAVGGQRLPVHAVGMELVTGRQKSRSRTTNGSA